MTPLLGRFVFLPMFLPMLDWLMGMMVRSTDLPVTP